MMPEDSASIKTAKEYLRENFDDGCECPACGQRVQLYRYKLYATSAWALIQLYKLHQTKPDQPYFHVSEYAEAGPGRVRAPHFAELRFWGLIAKMVNDDTKKKSSGFWGITDKGRRFAEGGVKLKSKILVFNNTFQGFADDAEFIDIREALDNKFDYPELMGTVVIPTPKPDVKPGQIDIFGNEVKDKFNSRQH